MARFGPRPALHAAALGLLILLTLAACGSTASGGSGSQTLKIAFLMPCSTCADRFENQDKPLFIKAVHGLDPNIQVIANNAQGSSATQLAQAESALTNGANVIVVSPFDEAAGSAIVAKASAQHVPVVSYDGLVTGAKPDYYISFQNEKVGELQAKFLTDHLSSGATIAVINGSQDIAPGRQFKVGAHKGLGPAGAGGRVVIGYEADIQGFERRQPGQVPQGHVGNLCPAQVQAL